MFLFSISSIKINFSELHSNQRPNVKKKVFNGNPVKNFSKIIKKKKRIEENNFKVECFFLSLLKIKKRILFQ